MNISEVRRGILEFLYSNNATSGNRICLREHLKEYNVPDQAIGKILRELRSDPKKKINMIDHTYITSLGYNSGGTAITLDNCGPIKTFITEDGIMELTKSPLLNQDSTDIDIISYLLNKMSNLMRPINIRGAVKGEGLDLTWPRVKKIALKLDDEGFAEKFQSMRANDLAYIITASGEKMLETYGTYKEYVNISSQQPENNEKNPTTVIYNTIIKKSTGVNVANNSNHVNQQNTITTTEVSKAITEINSNFEKLQLHLDEAYSFLLRDKVETLEAHIETGSWENNSLFRGIFRSVADIIKGIPTEILANILTQPTIDLITRVF